MHRALLIAAALIAVPVVAAAAEHRCPAPGTEVRFSLATAPLRYEGQDGLWCLRSVGGKPIHRELGHFRFFAANAERNELYDKTVAAAAQLWPIEPGKSVSYIYQATGGGAGGGGLIGSARYEVTVTVEPARAVTVPAGTFTAMPIVMNLRGTGSNYLSTLATYYYAPELGMNIKHEYRVVSGTGDAGDKPWEVVAITAPR
jgi:hypothetical protein